MHWQVMVDPFNLLALPVIPVTLAIDEHGIVRLNQPLLDKLPEIEAAFVNQVFDAPETPSVASIQKPDIERMADNLMDADSWLDYAIALTLWGGDYRLDEAIDAAQQALNINEDDRNHFYSGVIYRKRYDSDYRQTGDFQAAVNHWARALDIAPNNYIWRRAYSAVRSPFG